MKTLFDADEKVYKTELGCYWKLVDGVPHWKYGFDAGWTPRSWVADCFARWIETGTIKEVSDENIV